MRHAANTIIVCHGKHAPAGEEHGLPGSTQRLVLIAMHGQDVAGLKLPLSAPEQRREGDGRTLLSSSTFRASSGWSCVRSA